MVFHFLKKFELLSSNPYPKNTDTNPREVVEYYLQKHLPYNEPDVVLARVTIVGNKNNKQERVEFQLIDLADINEGFSAMARTTAFPTSIIGQMITHDIIKDKGVVNHESIVPEKEFKSQLAKRNIVFTEKYY